MYSNFLVYLHYDVIHVGQTRANESLFSYPIGESHEDFYNPDFRPLVDLSDADPVVVAAARQLCGEDEVECIFDYVTTNRESLALASKEAKKEYVSLAAKAVVGWYN